MTELVPASERDRLRLVIAELREKAELASPEEARHIVAQVASLTRQFRIKYGIGMPMSPIEQALEIDPKYARRPHLDYLSEQIAKAVRDVERGQNRYITISMPPRAGKSELTSFHTPTWILRRHPDWKIMLLSYTGELSGSKARMIRETIEQRPDLGIELSDRKSLYKWETAEKGLLYSSSTRGTITGFGANVVIIDDPIRDFIEAHSPTMRESLWNWWLTVVQTRLEPPYLVIAVATRWHEDDFIGRLLNPDFEGDPKQWEQIVLPAIAEHNDVLGREAGDPLMSPLIEETREEALTRWAEVRSNVGTYAFSAMFQQRPAPPKGAIFDVGWWRFWTRDPDRVTEDGRVVFFDPATMGSATWVDSWDCAFKGGVTDERTGGYVVGQRWVRHQANRFLIAQKRKHWSFTETIRELKNWAKTDDPALSPYGEFVHDRLIEERANGAAIIDTLRNHISGIKPINPTTSKEARARVVTPEIESGNVYLPHPSDPGNDWVNDLLSELRNFPNDVADDQVDALTQALTFLRVSGRGSITVPGASANPRPGGAQGWQVPRNITRAAASDMRRGGQGGPQIPRRPGGR